MSRRERQRFSGRRVSWARVAVSLLGGVVLIGLGVAAVAPPITLPVAGTPLDERWFAGYYDVTLDQGAELSESSLATSPGGAVLAFVVAASDTACTPTWGKAYTLDDAATRFDLDRRVERLRREGRPVTVSFGGAVNTELARACASPATLATAYGAVIDRYGTDTIDLDIEGETLADHAATARRAAAVALLQRERPADDPLRVWITLPVAPDGLPEDGLDLVSTMLDAGVQVSGVNAMTMNYGIQAPRDLVAVSTGALDATAAQLQALWDRAGADLPDGGVWAAMGATPMIGRNDVPTETFTLDDARELVSFASERGLARMSMWSLNRDHTCGSNYPFTGTVSTRCSGVEQAGESFADILSTGYLGRVEAAGPAADQPVVEDDPKTSPYPIWSSTAFYSRGIKVVWHGSVYVSKWWNEDGTPPDDPMLDTSASAWSYLGPVLASDRPFALPQLPSGTYPEWEADVLYDQGDRVLLDGTGYEARWWSRGQRPDRSILDRDYSPWTPIDAPPAGDAAAG